MKKKESWFARQKLNIKFTMIIGLILIIPVFGFFMVLFGRLSKDLYQQTTSNTRNTMNQMYNSVQKTVDLCNTTTQVFLSYKNLSEFLIRLEEATEIDTVEMINFYKNDIGMLEKIVNSNPYLYQIRVYANNNEFSEMMPILFKRERMEKFAWADEYQSGKWQYDYKDDLSLKSVNTSNHTMGLITNIEDYIYGTIGVIEVAVRMEDVFPNLFSSTNESWLGFVDDKGNVYSGKQQEECIWEENIHSIISEIDFQSDEERYEQVDLLDHKVIVGLLPIRELSGHLIMITNMEENLKGIRYLQGLYLLGMCAAIFFLVIIINLIVKALLKQFYNVMQTISLIQEGDMTVRVNSSGNGEMGQLGFHIDIMLDTISRLMKENIDRELLMKNSEIKALQNQINAHFIYNVLESIKMMAEIDEKYEISNAITSLGKLLRYGMKWSSKNVTVAQEIEYVKDYINLINLRFDYEIILAINIPESIYKQEIPKITIQPIVENAIYHGIEELAEDASIYIKAYEKGSDFYIEITDSGKGMNEESREKLQKKIAGEIETGGGSGNGIGLKNVQDRIRISFGSQYGIAIASKEDCYTKVIVKLPILHLEVNQFE